MKLSFGQSLFEVILAVGIATVILVGVVSLAAGTIRNSSFSNNNALASKYAQEATEWLRSERDRDWDIFRSNFGSVVSDKNTLCLSTLSWTNDCDPIPNTIFTRVVQFACFVDDPSTREFVCSNSSVNLIRTIIVVSWTDAQGDHSVRNSTYFANWR